MIKVCNIVDTQEVNGKRLPLGEMPGIAVKSHPSAHRAVVLVIGDMEYTVIASDLEAAVANAKNSNRHGL